MNCVSRLTERVDRTNLKVAVDGAVTATQDAPVQLKTGEALQEIFIAAQKRPEVWARAFENISSHRAIRARRLFKDYMSWSKDERSQAMAAIEGAIEWAQRGRPELLGEAIDEFRFAPRLAHALYEAWPASGKDDIEPSYNRWRTLVNQLAVQYQRLAFKLANEYQGKFGGTEDWVSCAYLALVRAAEMYVPGRAEFMTFAYQWIQAELKKACEKEIRAVGVTLNGPRTHSDHRELDTESHEDDVFTVAIAGPNQQFVAINRKKILVRAMSRLTEREREVIQRLYGLGEDIDGRMAKVVAAELGITVTRVRHLKAQALEKMQKALS